MPVEFRLPDVGEGLTEAEVVAWLVEEGDPVTEDQPVAEVETDKAVVEVPSPVNGTVRELRAEPGEVVPVGEVIIVFDAEDEADGDTTPESADTAPPTETETPDDAPETPDDSAPTADATTPGRTFAPPRVRRLARELGVDLAAVAAATGGGRLTEHDVRAVAEDTVGRDAPAPPEPASAQEPESEPKPALDVAPADAASRDQPVEAASRDRTAAAPATRGIARELGIDINSVPTDAERMGYPFVTATQVREFAAAREQAETPTPSTEATDSTASGAAEPTPAARPVERVPYRGLRRTIGQRMEQSAFTIPHVSAFHHPDVTELVETRAELKAEAEDRGVRLTYLPFVLKATVSALQAYPMFNAELDLENEELVYKGYYDIGVATATEDGLLVPVVEAVDQKGILELAAEVNDLAERARARELSPDELRGGTFTISNFGAISGEYATPLINYPQTGILGLGELKQRPRVVDGEVVARHTMPLSISFDHRVADGLDGGRFANHLIQRLEDPMQLLL